MSTDARVAAPSRTPLPALEINPLKGYLRTSTGRRSPRRVPYDGWGRGYDDEVVAKAMGARMVESRKVDRSGMPQVRTEPQEKEVIRDESEA
jgi:hypothetical protein